MEWEIEDVENGSCAHRLPYIGTTLHNTCGVYVFVLFTCQFITEQAKIKQGGCRLSRDKIRFFVVMHAEMDRIQYT